MEHFQSFRSNEEFLLCCYYGKLPAEGEYSLISLITFKGPNTFIVDSDTMNKERKRKICIKVFIILI